MITNDLLDVLRLQRAVGEDLAASVMALAAKNEQNEAALAAVPWKSIEAILDAFPYADSDAWKSIRAWYEVYGRGNGQ